MNINSKGAKNIFYKGANITAGIIKAGNIATFVYDGTQYQLVGIDTVVTQVKVGTTAYDPSSGIISLPAYPTSLPASNTVSTYSASGTAPVNGTAVAAALGTLDVSSVGGSGKYIQAISETDGKISATAQTLNASAVGLGNVGNFKAVSTVASQGLTSTEQSNARANIGAGTSSLTIGTTASTAAAGNHTHTPSSIGAAASSHTHYNIVTIGDQRSTATTPNSYSNSFAFMGLKSKATIGSPSDDTYSYLIGLRGWSDSSGGKSHELAFNDSGLYHRIGATTSWESWKKIAYTSDIPTYSANNGISLSGTTFSNSGVRSIATGTTNGTISVNTNGTAANVAVKGLGSAAYTASTAYASASHSHTPESIGAAATGHTHPIDIAASSGTSAISLAANTKYQLTAGGKSIIFTTPADTNTNNAVTQTATSTNANYEVLFSVTADNTTRTEGARKNSNLLFNPSTGNLQVTQINGVTVGSSPKFTDTTYSSQAAASGGTAVSLVTTGEKYTWNNHTHATSLASGGTATVNLAANTAYTLTAGGTSVVFKTPADSNTTYSAGTHMTLSGTTFNVTARNTTRGGPLGWVSKDADNILITSNTIAYWNGAYMDTSSNLEYCKKGAFGTIVTKNVGDYAAASHDHHSTAYGTQALRHLASGTAAATTTNCPSGAWYGYHS